MRRTVVDVVEEVTVVDVVDDDLPTVVEVFGFVVPVAPAVRTVVDVVDLGTEDEVLGRVVPVAPVTRSVVTWPTWPP